MACRAASASTGYFKAPCSSLSWRTGGRGRWGWLGGALNLQITDPTGRFPFLSARVYCRPPVLLSLADRSQKLPVRPTEIKKRTGWGDRLPLNPNPIKRLSPNELRPPWEMGSGGAQTAVGPHRPAVHRLTEVRPSASGAHQPKGGNLAENCYLWEGSARRQTQARKVTAPRAQHTAGLSRFTQKRLSPRFRGFHIEQLAYCTWQSGNCSVHRPMGLSSPFHLTSTSPSFHSHLVIFSRSLALVLWSKSWQPPATDSIFNQHSPTGRCDSH